MIGVYPATSRIWRPWKNGGGKTAEIAAFPPGAGFDNFDWRLSTAIVAADGPFSTFPGIDRVLTVLEGGPMALEITGTRHLVDSSSPPLAFPGDLPVMARLQGPPLLDFNLMLRRPLRASVTRGPLLPEAGPPKGLALLLEDKAGLSRFDLADLTAIAPELHHALAGVQAILVTLSAD